MRKSRSIQSILNSTQEGCCEPIGRLETYSSSISASLERRLMIRKLCLVEDLGIKMIPIYPVDMRNLNDTLAALIP